MAGRIADTWSRSRSSRWPRRAAGRSAISRFYTLDSTATPDAGPLASYGVIVGPVSVPASVDRPEFVVQVAPNRVEVDEFNRWAAPLGRQHRTRRRRRPRGVARDTRGWPWPRSRTSIQRIG